MPAPFRVATEKTRFGESFAALIMRTCISTCP